MSRYHTDPIYREQVIARSRAWSASLTPEQRRALSRKCKYSLTPEQVDEILGSQNGRCAICETTDPGKKRGGGSKVWSVDHDHKTGRIRGLLCGNCNAGLGLFKDDENILFAAAEYLIESRGKKKHPGRAR
jgi:hypothetical protein